MPWPISCSSHRRPRHGRDLRARRDRLHAGLADLADHQFRAGRVRHAAGLLRAGGDEVVRPAVLAGGAARRSPLSVLVFGLVFKTRHRRSDDQARRAAAGDLHHGAVDLHEGRRQGRSTAPRPSPSRRSSPTRWSHSPASRLAAAYRRARRRLRHHRGAAMVPRRHAHRPADAGHRAEPDGRAHPRHRPSSG